MVGKGLTISSVNVYIPLVYPGVSTSQTSSSPVTTGQAGPEGTATSQEVEPTSSKTTSQVAVSPTPTSMVQHSFLPITATTPAKTSHPSASVDFTGLQE